MVLFSLRVRTLAAVAAFAIPLAMTQTASAATAPVLSCGNTTPGPCQQTVHFNQINDRQSPAPPDASCPAFLSNDFFTFVGTGNGVEHANLNSAQDGWFTYTFTGGVTITPYLYGVIDSNGNVTSVSGPDPDHGPLTGRITEWFGGSFNNKNFLFHGTIEISVTDASGASLRVHVVSHASWTPGADPSRAPHIAFDKVTCG